MTDHAQHPLLFRDVDGPLLPFGEDPGREPRSVGIVLGAVGGLAAGLVFAGAWRSAGKTSATGRELRQSRREMAAAQRDAGDTGTPVRAGRTAPSWALSKLVRKPGTGTAAAK